MFLLLFTEKEGRQTGEKGEENMQYMLYRKWVAYYFVNNCFMISFETDVTGEDYEFQTSIQL